MRDFLKNWISILVPKNAILPVSEQNKQALRNDLKKCYTQFDIELLKAILGLSAGSFSTRDLVDFNLEIDYRRRMIEYVDTRLKNQIFQTREIATMFHQAQSRIEVDALCLHLEINNTIYERRSEGMWIYKSMAAKRNEALLQEMYSQSA